MEITGKEVRIALQKKLNEIRQQKGIKLSDMNLTDEQGKSLSAAHKSMLFSGKRQMGLWLLFQIAKALNTTIGFNPKLRFKQTKSFLKGDDCCEFVFELD